MRWSIRYQLLAPLILLLLGIAGISSWTAVASAGRARRQIEMQVRNVGHVLSEASFALNERVLEHMKGLSGADYLLVTHEGRLATLRNADVDLPAAGEVTENWQDLRLGPPVQIGSQRYLCSGVRLRQPGQTLYILYPERLWQDARWEAVRPSLVLGGCVGLASMALAVGVGRRLSRRIQELERRTRLIAAGDFSPMPLPGRDDELRDLGRSVNDMAARLAQLQEAVLRAERLRVLGQLSSGLAHQLRNGAAGARLAVQLHARGCPGSATDEALTVALRQLDLLEANLKRFLDLGREDRPSESPCSVAALLEGTLALLRPQCRHARTELRWEPPPAELIVRGDATRLGHLFLNVITNAIEAAGPGGWVAVEARAEKERAVVDVIDSGPGPPAAVAERLFEPFQTGKPEGVGLGLAVARQVAEAHGGRVDWLRAPGPTHFRIELPLARTEPSGGNGKADETRTDR